MIKLNDYDGERVILITQGVSEEGKPVEISINMMTTELKKEVAGNKLKNIDSVFPLKNYLSKNPLKDEILLPLDCYQDYEEEF